MEYNVKPHVFSTGDWQKLPPRERHLHTIALWAESLPESAWQPFPVSQLDGTYVAVRMQTGRILTGRARVFGPETLRRLALDPEYGSGNAWVMAGD